MKSETYNSTDRQFKERFEAVIKRIGTLEKAGALVGTSGEQVGKWRDEKAKAPFLAIAILADAGGVSTDWLAFGRETALSQQQSMNSAPEEFDEVAFVPLLDVVASAGPGIVNAKPYALDLLPFPRIWLQRMGLPEQYARFLGARGDSMEPTILDGALCLADTRFQHAQDEGIYVLVDGENVRIKRIARGWEGKVVLISDNERYESETLAAPDAEALRIAGKIVWAGGEI